MILICKELTTKTTNTDFATVEQERNYGFKLKLPVHENIPCTIISLIGRLIFMHKIS